METRMLVAGLAVVAGFGCACAVALELIGAMRRRRAAVISQGGDATVAGFLAWRIRNGFRFLRPLADMLLGVRGVAGFADEALAILEQRGIASTRPSVLSVLMVAMSALALVAWAVTGSAIGAVAVAACAGCLVVLAVNNARDKRREAIREAVPDAIESMSACFGSGFTLLQTFKQVAEDSRGPLGQTFSKSAHVLEMGGSAEESLAELKEGAHASELAFVAVALDVQHQSGGAMKQVLDAAADTVKGELALRRTLRVQTAQAKLSARVVVAMPFILVAAFSLATPDFLMPFFSSALGYGLLALAIVMQVTGVLLVRRALSVEGVS